MNAPPGNAPVEREPPDPTGPESAGVPARGGKFCEMAHDPCQMCQELAGARVVRSDELLQGKRELFIVHGNQVYRLLRTRNDKLILHK